MRSVRAGLIGPALLCRQGAPWGPGSPSGGLVHPHLVHSLLRSPGTFFPGGSDGVVSARNVGDPGSIPGLGRSPGEGNGNPLQYSAWKIPGTEEPGGLRSMWSRRVGHD